MPASVAIYDALQAALNQRVPAAFSSRRSHKSVAPTGIEAIDAVLGGGLPDGAITELVGQPCSGHVTVALACLSAKTRSGSVCAWIDVSDALDPESAAANGVDLERLLWVRCTARPGATVVQAAPDSPPAVLTSVASPPLRHTGGGSPHPRSEGRDMPEAISAMMQAHGGLYDKQLRREKRVIGTPGAPNRPLSQRSEDREEQVNSDRLPPRRGANLVLAPRCAEPLPRRVAQKTGSDRLPLAPHAGLQRNADTKPWQALDQALRAADLLLQGGGFNTIVLDLGGIQPEVVWRIPLATWFRFRAACERTQVSLLLLTQHSCARSSAGLVVRLQTGSMQADGRVMTGIRYKGQAERSRAPRMGEVSSSSPAIRKPPQSDHYGHWVSEASWAQTK